MVCAKAHRCKPFGKLTKRSCDKTISHWQVIAILINPKLHLKQCLHVQCTVNILTALPLFETMTNSLILFLEKCHGYFNYISLLLWFLFQIGVKKWQD